MIATLLYEVNKQHNTTYSIISDRVIPYNIIKIPIIDTPYARFCI